MIRRTSNSPASPLEGQLGLPFDAPKEVKAQAALPCEPITVRIAEAIRLTGIRRSKLYELIASGDIESVKVGRCTLVPVASLHALVERARRGKL